jgi:hypoxanthine phosphoribosyltransferase
VTSVHSDVGEVLIDEDTLRGRVEELGAEVSADYEGRDVLVVEDIIDSGLTLSYLRRTLGARKPASLEICALLTKPERREVDVPVRYVGFEIPNRFVIGYGLDFAERYRNLPYIGVLHPDLVPNGL